MGTRIFWAGIIGFILGVFARTNVQFGWVTIGFVVFCAIVVAVMVRIELAMAHRAFLLSIVLLAFAGGATRMHGGVIESDPTLDSYVGSKVVLEGIIVDEPDVREDSVRLPVRIASVASTSIESSVSVLVVVPLHTDVAYGDVIHAEGELRVPESFESGDGRVFDYPGYLAKDGNLYQMSFAKVSRTGKNEGNLLKSWAIWLKQKYLEGLANSLSEPQAGLAGGITVGDKRGLGEELSDTFRTVGLTHIVVLSGYNIMVVVDSLLRWLSRFPQAVRLSLAGFVALFFAAITGFASASTRAAMMAMIAITGKATGRTYLASRALALVAVGMILWNPYILLYDPGFQLSILATAGLIFLSPLITPYLLFVPERLGLREIAASSISAQLAVLPLLLYQNGILTLFSLPVNLLALAVIPMAMFFSAIAAIVGLFAGAVAPIFGLPAYALLSYVIYVAKGFAALPFSSVSIPAFSATWLILVYMILFGIVLKMHKKAAGHEVPPHR
ncbi:hypothetical protein A2765_01990 [Candidatus Kaiserbacteria bacterium RIFCSPHIGHO2_01_FULL_56_24]|uniref:ComEC/Rec2-related protein domain-containing protein n=1 Tax=Candidatus Kaiserbacteria bacterium RIFCSPHIGHO2_01_FULL_56_24 TaxID=1798487 RepID=A0A1F6DBS9_9BACT|nr:MAG: hypothetical protein A2765_01990 [Candidatus Kaiserbacteria bacterium RIFCSPHIGHO2_01_FULL_56_24]